jgi:WD40 repeat protein
VAQLWDAKTHQPVGNPLGHEGTLRAAAFSPDGQTVATAGGDEARETGEARLWDAATGRPLGPPLTHHHTVNALAYSPDGQLLLTGSSDRTARLWDVATGRPVGPPVLAFRDPQAIEAVAFSANGKDVLVSGADGPVQSWMIPAPAVGDVKRIERWAQVIGGKELDGAGGCRPLDPAAWQDRLRLLAASADRPTRDPTMTAPLAERRKRYKEPLRQLGVPLGNLANVGG